MILSAMMGFYKMETVSAVNLFNLNKSACLSEDLEMEKAVVDICSKEEFHAILVREKARADRNGHGFSLVAVDISNHENVSSLQKEFKQRIRTTDEIGWFDQNVLGVFLYNTAALGAWQFVNKGEKKTSDRLSTLKCSVYSYPNDWCNF